MKSAEFGRPCAAVAEPGGCRICGASAADEAGTLCPAPGCIAAARAEIIARPDQAEDLTRPYDGPRFGFAE